jgi:formylmethanofuran dehydrogenase subunit B
MKRYSYVSKGFWTAEGKKDKKLIVVDVRVTKSSRLADVFIQVKSGGDYALFSALRAILRGHADVIPDEVSGVPKEKLLEVAEMVKKAKFGITFFGMGVTHTRGRHNNIVNAIQFTRAAHLHGKWTIMPMRGHYNVTGFNQVCTWQTGFPFSVDFARGYPWYNPGETSSTDLLGRGEADAALIIASDPGAHFPGAALRHLAKIPVIQIDPFANPTTEFADVIIPSTISGIESEGGVYRMDNVPLRLRKILDTDFYIPDEVIVERIMEEVRAIKEKEGE